MTAINDVWHSCVIYPSFSSSLLLYFMYMCMKTWIYFNSSMSRWNVIKEYDWNSTLRATKLDWHLILWLNWCSCFHTMYLRCQKKHTPVYPHSTFLQQAPSSLISPLKKNEEEMRRPQKNGKSRKNTISPAGPWCNATPVGVTWFMACQLVVIIWLIASLYHLSTISKTGFPASFCCCCYWRNYCISKHRFKSFVTFSLVYTLLT